jgi:Concanavalin A-like lectin/glucanases superfamily
VAGIIAAEELLVDLRAEDLPYGVATGMWANHGTLGDFTAMGAPLVEDIDGRKCITFDGSSYFEGPNSTPGLEGQGATRSIEVWALNPDIPSEETIVSWAHRGGPDGTNMAFNYGNNASFGAVGHWGSADMAWAGQHSPSPAANNWWHLVYTHDGTTSRLYVNGELETEGTHSLNTFGGTPIRVAAQADGTGAGADAGFNFTGSIAEVRIHDGVLSAADIANNFVSEPGDPVAGAPNPEDAQTDVLRDVVLSWEAGPFAAAHDVYLGTTFEDVNDADRVRPMGVLISRNQTATTYAPETVLEFGQTYHWRVDEVNAAPDNTIFKGDMWSFTVEPFAYPVENIVATSNATSEPDFGPEKTVDGSGLDAEDQHSTANTDMWTGTPPTGETAYILYEFDGTYKLHEMQVWNYNVMFEPLLGFGFKDVTIEYSENGQDWTVLADVQFAQATARADYAANTVVDLEGIAAKSIRLTANSTYGVTGQVGLSEVRLLSIPVQPREPEPADGATDVSVDTMLDWRAGREATAHEVHFGTDAEALALLDTVAESQYDPGTLDLGTTYYWQIAEVNEAEAISAWAGPLWSFASQEYIVVDDFESYDDEENRIFDVWLDGFANETGSTVGYFDAPFAERTIVHSGRQSMPLAYDNTGGTSLSEAELMLDATQDWTTAGVTTLVLLFYGDLENDAGEVYVKINDTKVTGGGTTAMALWKQWNIDLASTGANLQNVSSVTIGIEGAGAGTIYVDDLRLYAAAPAVIEPVDPGTNGLAASYTFENNVTDVTGNGYDGTSADAAFFDDAPGDLGRAMSFDGIDDHIDLPIGSLLGSLTDITVATWVNFSNTGGNWQRLFDFGTSNTAGYMFLCPSTGAAGPVRFAITPTAGAGESFVDTSSSLPSGWHHVATVIDSATMTMSVYIDGAEAASGPTGTLPQDLGVTTQNWLGRSQYAADAYFNGLLAELSIYSRALSPGEIRYLAGDR